MQCFVEISCFAPINRKEFWLFFSKNDAALVAAAKTKSCFYFKDDPEVAQFWPEYLPKDFTVFDFQTIQPSPTDMLLFSQQHRPHLLLETPKCDYRYLGEVSS